MNLTKQIRTALAALGVGRRRITEVFEWAAQNPEAGMMLCRAAAGFAAHRIHVLSLRKRGWRLKHRINRWCSAEKQLQNLANEFKELSAQRAICDGSHR